MVSHSFLLFFFLRPIQTGPVLAQQTFCFSAKGGAVKSYAQIRLQTLAE